MQSRDIQPEPAFGLSVYPVAKVVYRSELRKWMDHIVCCSSCCLLSVVLLLFLFADSGFCDVSSWRDCQVGARTPFRVLPTWAKSLSTLPQSLHSCYGARKDALSLCARTSVSRSTSKKRELKRSTDSKSPTGFPNHQRGYYIYQYEVRK